MFRALLLFRFLLLAAVVVLAVFLVSLFAGLRRARKRALERLKALLEGVPIQLGPATASFLGFQSRESSQARGTGTLVLTSRKLLFEFWGPARTVAVAADQVIDVDLVPSFLGKKAGLPFLKAAHPVLKVTFRTPEGTPEGAGWLVREPELWKDRLSYFRRTSPAAK